MFIRFLFQRLTKLNIAMCNQVSARMLANLVGALPNVQSLNLQQTKCNDQVLGAIASSCRQLRELNVLGCPISDMGVMSLVVAFNPDQPKCEKLLKLDISSTAVTSKGASIALTNLKQLRFLVYPDMCDVLYRLHHSHQAEDEVAKEKQHNLRLLTVSFLKSNLGPVEKTVEVSCAFCPYITEVNFIHGVTNESLLYLSSLEHLRVLYLANCDEESITFEEGLVPLLQMRGEQLHEISLYEINNVDIGVIGACCPNLRKFTSLIAGFKNAKFPMHSHPEILMLSHHKPFTKLTHLKILLHTPEKFFPPEYLKSLLCNAKQITEVQLAFIETLTDSILEDVLNVNQLEHLETLTLENCDKVTVAPMLLLLEGPNDLTHLTLKRCKEITLQNFEYLADLAKSNQYDLEILWT